MSPSQRDDRLHRLLERLVNETISSDEHEELQSLLTDDPAAQSAYFGMQDLHMGLQKLTATAPTDEALPSVGGDFVQPTSTAAQEFHSDSTRVGSSNRPVSLTAIPVSYMAMIATFAAMVFLVAAGAAFLRSGGDRFASRMDGQPPQSEQTVADDPNAREAVLLVQAAGAELFGDFLPPVGEALEFDHEYALTAGLIELRFPDGAEVILEAPSVIEIAGRQRLLVRAGSCSVHAPDGAEGFQVETPQTEITDLGTRFSVSVNEAGETDVQVVEGLAEVRPTQNGLANPIQLVERQARRFNGDTTGGPQPLPFNATEYRGTLPDRVVSYQARMTKEGFASELQNITVQRDGREQTFAVSDLIGVKVIHFRCGMNNANVAVPIGYDGDRLAALELDASLHTGLLNPGGAVEPLHEDPVLSTAGEEGTDSTPGLGVRFRRPVVNKPGPDVVFFELQSVVNPPQGDAFHVSPLRFNGGQRSWTVRRFDIAMTSREALQLPAFDLFFFKRPATSLESLITGEVDRRVPTLRFRALAVGIDLSDLGYAAGERVEGLFFQDALDDNSIVDPVFIAGLP